MGLAAQSPALLEQHPQQTKNTIMTLKKCAASKNASSITKSSQLPDWQKIDAVLLDMDGTLLDLHYDTYFWTEYLPLKLSLREDITLAEAQALVVPRLLQQQGTLSFYCIDYWQRIFAMEILALQREIADKITWRAGAWAFLNWLKKSGKKVIMATNAHRATIDMKFDKTGLDDFFHAVSSSHDYGVAKEEPHYWRRFAQDYQINLSQALLIDDNQQVLQAAASMGVAQCLGIRQPDSQRPPVEVGGYPVTDDFSELLFAWE